MNGDSSIEHHLISQRKEYASYSYPGLPTVRQLVVLVWHLTEIDIREFVVATLAEKCCTPEKWDAWKKEFGLHFGKILGFKNFGESLAADRERGSPFINAIVKSLATGEKLPAPRTGKFMLRLSREFFKARAEKMMPLTEALFMVMRGHNDVLLDSEEGNEPACAEGAYLGMLKAIAELNPGGALFPGVSLLSCDFRERAPLLPLELPELPELRLELPEISLEDSSAAAFPNND